VDLPEKESLANTLQNQEQVDMRDNYMADRSGLEAWMQGGSTGATMYEQLQVR